MTDLLIWWTTQEDCGRLGCPALHDWPLAVPAYIVREYLSRYGRNGRGRLWIPEGLPDVRAEETFETSHIAAELENASAAGIVFRREDVAAVAMLPGTITDTLYRRVTPLVFDVPWAERIAHFHRWIPQLPKTAAPHPKYAGLFAWEASITGLGPAIFEGTDVRFEMARVVIRFRSPPPRPGT